MPLLSVIPSHRPCPAFFHTPGNPGPCAEPHSARYLVGNDGVETPHRHHPAANRGSRTRSRSQLSRRHGIERDHTRAGFPDPIVLRLPLLVDLRLDRQLRSINQSVAPEAARSRPQLPDRAHHLLDRAARARPDLGPICTAGIKYWWTKAFTASRARMESLQGK